jgi:hypothetical protein
LRGLPRIAVCGAAVGLAALLAPTARALEFAPVTEFPAPPEDPTRLDVMLGASFAYDSNPARLSGDESDTALEYLVGLGYYRRNARTRYTLGAELRAERYSEFTRYDYEEYVLKGDVKYFTNKVRFGLAARHAALVDPVQISPTGLPTLDFLDLLERTDTRILPEAALSFGKAELAAGYLMNEVDYEDANLGYLDFENAAFNVEFRLGRPEVNQYFVHWDSGDHDFGAFDPFRPRYDFEYSNLYLGWRATSVRKSSLEIGVGTYELESRNPASAGQDGVFVKALLTQVMRDGTSALQAGYTRTAEASPVADYQETSRMVLRYSRRKSPHTRWTAGFKLASSDYANPVPGSGVPSSLLIDALDLGFERKLGSPQRWHGRFYFSVALEMGEAPLVDGGSDEYDRLRALLGLALTH